MKQHKQLKIRLALGISQICSIILFASQASAVTFNVEFESPSRWDNPEYNQAKEYIKEFLNELGDELASDALIGVYITDDETEANSPTFASAFSAPESTFITRDNRLEFLATVAWKRINKGYNGHGVYQKDGTGNFVKIPNNGDLVISYNFKKATLSVNDPNLKSKVRQLLRHEIMHPLGMTGHSQGAGQRSSPTIFESEIYYNQNSTRIVDLNSAVRDDKGNYTGDYDYRDYVSSYDYN
ncbi:MAG: hypothetical protein F6K18_27610 [Okeania sp. SIO2C2]|uniref:hypothetical protein n=1 Tax=Okeania sp. SIO2C2 TaxID=2607787 RepID=UPI0013BE12C3|nr:hypothetical protein [Okeania sp. SIO2C2]NEP90292.1 hypothetical protein [Okeania sp. SIO2C2]